MKLFYILITALLISPIAAAQNRDDFFKTIPLVDAITPTWAKLMYSKNPNVAKVEDMFMDFYHKNEFVKTIHTQNHKHWIRQVEPLLNDQGFIVVPNKAQEDAYFKSLKANYQQGASRSVAGSQNGWVSMGPFETFKKNTTKAISWHKNVYSIDQSMSNPNVLICGTEGGGVYKTINKGASWTLISKGEVFSGGNSAVVIHPKNSNKFLIAANKRIYQSLNGGQSWVERKNTNGTGNEFQYSPSDTNIIFHTSSTGLYKSINGGATWSQIYTQACWDIDFHPTDSSIAYLLKSNPTAKKTEFYQSSNGGNNWVLKTTGWYTPSNLSFAKERGGKIAVTAAAPNIVYVCLIGEAKQNDEGWIGIYKSSNKGNNWTNSSGQDGGPYTKINDTTNWNVAAYKGGYHQGYYNFDCEASTLDSNKIWVATIRLSESKDGGKTFKSIGAANSTRLTDFHADVQDIEVNGNDVWVASDGGINLSTNELTTHVALNKGIQAADFWGFNTGWNEDTYTGGKYHDGTSGWYEGYGSGKAYNIGGVEEASGYVHPIENRKLIYRTHYASSVSQVNTIPKTFGGSIKVGNAFPIRPNEHYLTAERSGFYFDPRYANHIYTGLNHVIYKSKDGGNSFDSLFAFSNPKGLVYEIEISRSNPNILYAVYNPLGGYWNPCEIWKSTNTGKTWTKTATPVGNNRRFRISIQPDDGNKIWICTPRGVNGQKVYYSSNGGTAWVNKTTSVLNNENLEDIYYQSGANDVVYVVSQNGVFHWDKNTSNWVKYSTGLPLVAKSLQINPFYRDGELRLASKGRGIWARKMKDTSFAPVAQPITYSDSVFCARDTVYFDCYSILNHQGASWTWKFSPKPFFVSDTSTRNPFVIFGKSGSYTVTLAVKDGNNKTSSKTISNMVTVGNKCNPDTVPGSALKCNTKAAYVSIPDLKLTQVDSFTVSAWIMPYGLQNNWAAILMDDNTQAGLNFYKSGWKPNLQLGYHWPGGSWSWTSGLSVDSLVWSHVAMVVKPTGITIYVNGIGSTHARTLSKTTITSMKIGSYKAWSSRNFYGLIDEVSVWDRALSQEEIREIKHLTRTGNQSSTNNLKAYYQFNFAENSIVMDKVGTNHGNLIGAAKKVISTVPVGGGTSDRILANLGSNYLLTNTATEIQFGTIKPNGEIVVTRINQLPDSIPTNNPNARCYWILNNYGTKNFSSILNLKLSSAVGPPFRNPQNVELLSRSENGHKNNWTSKCMAGNFNQNKFNFLSSCSIRNSQQFFIQSKNSKAIIGTMVTNQNKLSICDNDSVFLGGKYRNTAGSYYDTIVLAQNKDSVTISILSINKTAKTTDNQMACDSLKWVDGITYYEKNNSAQHLLTTKFGCDSLVTLNLIIRGNSMTDSIEACNEYKWINGITYSESSDTNKIIYTSSLGCDSTINLILKIKKIDTKIKRVGDSLKANELQGKYQWLDCQNNYLILRGDSFPAVYLSKNGSYALSISKNGCVDTSNCLSIENVGLNEGQHNGSFHVYPNPTSGKIGVALDKDYDFIVTKIWDTNGKLVSMKEHKETNFLELEISGAAGTYILDVIANDKTKTSFRIIKE